jgi:hypothetical protein
MDYIPDKNVSYFDYLHAGNTCTYITENITFIFIGMISYRFNIFVRQ